MSIPPAHGAGPTPCADGSKKENGKAEKSLFGDTSNNKYSAEWRYSKRQGGLETDLVCWSAQNGNINARGIRHRIGARKDGSAPFAFKPLVVIPNTQESKLTPNYYNQKTECSKADGTEPATISQERPTEHLFEILSVNSRGRTGFQQKINDSKHFALKYDVQNDSYSLIKTNIDPSSTDAKDGVLTYLPVNGWICNESDECPVNAGKNALVYKGELEFSVSSSRRLEEDNYKSDSKTPSNTKPSKKFLLRKNPKSSTKQIHKPTPRRLSATTQGADARIRKNVSCYEGTGCVDSEFAVDISSGIGCKNGVDTVLVPVIVPPSCYENRKRVPNSASDYNKMLSKSGLE